MAAGDGRRALETADAEAERRRAERVDLEQSTEDEEELQVGSFQAFLQDRRKIASWLLVFLVGIFAIYIVFPRVVGVQDALARVDEAVWYWIVIAIAFNVGAFAAYVALFKGILGRPDGTAVHHRLDVRASYQVTMAGLAATRIFSAGGAGGIILTYWALRKAGMPRRRSACRMVAFIALLYTVYPVSLILFGVLLRAGVLGGEAPVAGTIVPAAVAGVVILFAGLVCLIPRDIERRIAEVTRGYRRARWAKKLASGPATMATGVRLAVDYLRHPRRSALAIFGAVGFWAANIGVLWASFEAFGGEVPLAVLVQGFFIGMAANLIPSPAGGVGSVDAGMIAAFALFDIPGSVVFPAVLLYRVIAFWLPIPPGIVAFLQLRRTVAEWEDEDANGARPGVYTSESKVSAEAT